MPTHMIMRKTEKDHYLEGVFKADDVVDPLLEVEDAVLVRPLAAASPLVPRSAVAADDDAEREEGVDVAEVAHHRLQRHQQPGLLHQFLREGWSNKEGSSLRTCCVRQDSTRKYT